ncbi:MULTISPECIES: hypothetical protein [unclassified Methanoculleus]|uniref:hypothetical protein n=1 Tax=unclassified Methanoculleus TaxID=2619537 RepID=UPI0025E3C74F|nr:MULTISPECIES: hypothetical protein [unclassified Methanoculleus]MCK9317928.1 hypothetical protein [Methanoculleus sp.]MDD2253718.1 hypothetical protein [Methanoculleus sp.]MDD2787771.1 hypothetical protein [Methanoculleus sp.]MDD3216991.1 hypothetical protein [Methanoculleus sp.]MDD4314481.1 hypothetical protein [Methanoculleus sp.]
MHDRVDPVFPDDVATDDVYRSSLTMGTEKTGSYAATSSREIFSVETHSAPTPARKSFVQGG